MKYLLVFLLLLSVLLTACTTTTEPQQPSFQVKTDFSAYIP